MTSEARAKLEEAILDYAQDFVNLPYYRVTEWNKDMKPALDAYDAARIPDRDKVIDAIYYALPSADGLYVSDIHAAADAVIGLLKGENNAD